MCSLLCVSALVATAAYAYAASASDDSAPLAPHTITVTNPGAQTTNPLSAPSWAGSASRSPA